eukprot:gene18172-19986_t
MAEHDLDKENEVLKSNENVEFQSGPIDIALDTENEDEITPQFVPVKNALQGFLALSDDSFDDLIEVLDSMKISSLTQKDRKSLGNLLDRRGPFERDYVGLASSLFPELISDKLFKIEKQKSPTAYLLKKYENEKKDQATLLRLVEIAFAMPRLDVVKLLVNVAQGKGQIGEYSTKKQGFMKQLKRKIFKDDDTISIGSVRSSASSLSLSSIASYQSQMSLCSVESHHFFAVEKPVFEGNFAEREQIYQNCNDLNSKKLSVKAQHPFVFIVSASDETANTTRLVKWLTNKGVHASSIETNYNEFKENSPNFINRQLERADNVLIICSQRLKMILDHKSGDLFTKDDLADVQVMQYVLQYMNNQIFCDLSKKSKYIPLVAEKEMILSGKASIIPMPLNSAEAYYFQNSDSRQDLLRRIFKREKFKLPPVGNRPVLKQNVITGELLDFASDNFSDD